MLSCLLGQVVVPSSEARFLAFTAAGQRLGLQRESVPTVSSRRGLSSSPLPSVDYYVSNLLLTILMIVYLFGVLCNHMYFYFMHLRILL